MKDDLGDRMKKYEYVWKNKLMIKTPVLIRIDGKAFHTLTRGFDRPFDDVFMQTMWEIGKHLCESIQGCKLAYIQSDEINLLLIDYEKIESNPWFDYNIQKLVSVSASIASSVFGLYMQQIAKEEVGEWMNHHEKIPEFLELYDKRAVFDARCFNLPMHEVINYFIWRQRDAIKNSVQMQARAFMSHKQMHGKTSDELRKILVKEYESWENLAICKQRGVTIFKKYYTKDDAIRSKWNANIAVPVFSEERDYIDKLVYPGGKNG